MNLYSQDDGPFPNHIVTFLWNALFRGTQQDMDSDNKSGFLGETGGKSVPGGIPEVELVKDLHQRAVERYY